MAADIVWCGTMYELKAAPEETMSTNEVIFRLARAEDKAELMAMSVDVYDGMDYLAAIYDQWIKEAEQTDPIRFNFVAILDRQIVGFFSLLFFSEKSSVIESAVRTHPGFRGMGIFKKMEEFSTSFIKSLTPSCWKITSFTDKRVADDAALERLKASKGEELVKRNHILMEFNAKSWINRRGGICDSTGDFSNFEMVGKEFLENILEDGSWRDLLTNGVLHVNWDPYVPGNKEDVGYIAGKDLTIIKDDDSFSIFQNEKEITSGFCVGLDIFCRSLEQFKSHLVHQLDRYAAFAREGEIKLFIFSPLKWTQDVMAFLRGSCQVEDNRFLWLGGYRSVPTMFIYRQSIQK